MSELVAVSGAIEGCISYINHSKDFSKSIEKWLDEGEENKGFLVLVFTLGPSKNRDPKEKYISMDADGGMRELIYSSPQRADMLETMRKMLDWYIRSFAVEIAQRDGPYFDDWLSEEAKKQREIHAAKKESHEENH